MTIDMTNNRVPCGLLTDEEKAALHEHEKAGGEFEHHCDGVWFKSFFLWINDTIYRTLPLPKTQDVIAWDRLPDWVEWVARDVDGEVWAFDLKPDRVSICWTSDSNDDDGTRRIDDFPGIVSLGTCDWTESKQRRPR
jgi:hypothetical protein